MKKLRLILLFFIASLFFTGCFLQTVHPLVKPENSILLPGLEGRWFDDETRWTFINDLTKFPELSPVFEGDPEHEEDSEFKNAYLVLYENLDDASSDTALFVGSVIKLDGAYFLDLELWAKSLGELENTENSFVDSHLFPVHTISKISVNDKGMELEFFKSSFIKELISSNRVRIKHEKVDEDILITASTEELQKFVEKYANEEEAFEDPLKLSYREPGNE